MPDRQSAEASADPTPLSEVDAEATDPFEPASADPTPLREVDAQTADPFEPASADGAPLSELDAQTADPFGPASADPTPLSEVDAQTADPFEPASADPTPLLEVEGLRVTFNAPTGPVRAVRGVSLHVNSGEILGVAGESGCGKSVLFRALLGLLPATADVDGTVRFDGTTMDTDGSLKQAAALIYQNPGAALNPVFTIGRQLQFIAGTKDPAVLCDLLAQAGLREPERLLDAYPHEFSGGMSQRAVIAAALAQRPRLLIADEPTTALDVTTQSLVLDLIAELRERHRLAVVLISHDLAVIQRVCDRVMVLYAGEVVETGVTASVLTAPAHPYTRALLDSVPRAETVGSELASIPGLVPDGRQEISGCAFAPRCPHAHDRCQAERPALLGAAAGQRAACVLLEP